MCILTLELWKLALEATSAFALHLQEKNGFQVYTGSSVSLEITDFGTH